MNIAILGGTGKEGAGLASRWARVGHSIIIGSRDRERAKTKATELREHTHKVPIIGESNAAVRFRVGESRFESTLTGRHSVSPIWRGV